MVLYRNPVFLLRKNRLCTTGEGKYVGTNPAHVIVWQATRHLQFQRAVSRFLSGNFLKNTFVADGFGFYSATALYRF